MLLKYSLSFISAQVTSDSTICIASIQTTPSEIQLLPAEVNIAVLKSFDLYTKLTIFAFHL